MGVNIVCGGICFLLVAVCILVMYRKMTAVKKAYENLSRNTYSLVVKSDPLLPFSFLAAFFIVCGMFSLFFNTLGISFSSTASLKENMLIPILIGWMALMDLAIAGYLLLGYINRSLRIEGSQLYYTDIKKNTFSFSAQNATYFPGNSLIACSLQAKDAGGNTIKCYM